MKTKQATIARPWQTVYHATRRQNYVSAQGNAETIQGAIRATVVKLALGLFNKAIIVNRYDGEIHVILTNSADGNTINFDWKKEQVPQ